MFTFSISQKGQFHIEYAIPCQDYSMSLRLNSDNGGKEYILAAEADGVGSCLFSHIASEIAVNTCIEYLREHLTDRTQDDPDIDSDVYMFKILKATFSEALERVIKKADEMELPVAEFDTTLTAVIYDGSDLWYGHIGDDGCVVLYADGTCEMITTRHKGKFAHSLIPLRVTDTWEFGKASGEVASFALMTDGVLDYCVDGEQMNNRVFFPFLEPALTAIPYTEQEVTTIKSDWEEFLRGEGDYPINFRDEVHDDITLVVGLNPNAVSVLPEITFDSDKWYKALEAENSSTEQKEVSDDI